MLLQPMRRVLQKCCGASLHASLLWDEVAGVSFQKDGRLATDPSEHVVGRLLGNVLSCFV